MPAAVPPQQPVPRAASPALRLGRPAVAATATGVTVRIRVSLRGPAVLRVEARSGRRYRVVATRALRVGGVQRIRFVNRGYTRVRILARPAEAGRWTTVRTAAVPQPVPSGY